MKELIVRTHSRFELIDITGQVQGAVTETALKDGFCHVFVPHTTAALTINENADPDVPVDILKELDCIIPLDDGYRHIEGNSAAHIKASLIGSWELVMVEKGQLMLGTWQSIFFCEFDGPRTRKVWVKTI